MGRNVAREIDSGLADILASAPANVEEIRAGLGVTLDEFAEVVGRSVRTVCRWQAEGDAGASARGDAAREIRKLAQLHYLVDDVLGTGYGKQWLRSPNRGFKGRAPIDLVLDGDADAVIAALERLADGGPV